MQGATVTSGYKTDNVVFPAFLTSFTQNFTSTWNEEVVYGRMDPIQTYAGTQRVVSLQWELVAANLIDAQENLTKLQTETIRVDSYRPQKESKKSRFNLRHKLRNNSLKYR